MQKRSIRKGVKMAKRMQVYPPSGGEPIEISAEDLASFEAKGWTASPRSSKPKAAKAVKSTPKSED
jgi:hypothetical protein